MDWLQKEIYSGCSGTWSARAREWLRGFKDFTDHKFMLRYHSVQLHALCLWYTTTAAAPFAQTWNALNNIIL